MSPDRTDHHSTVTRARALFVTLSSVLAPLFERYGITDPGHGQGRGPRPPRRT